MSSTSLNVTFVTSTTRKDVSISAELDAEKNVDSNGNAISQFPFGSFAHFLVFTEPKDLRYDIYVSDNNATVKAGQKNAIKQFEGDVTFTPNQYLGIDNWPTLSKPINSIISYNWFGNNLGQIVPVGDGKSVKVLNKGVGVAKIKYTSKANEHSILLQLPNGVGINEEYSQTVVVFITEKIE